MSSTLNIDLIQTWNVMNRFRVEIQQSASANVNFVALPDKTRIKQFVSALRTLTDYISKEPGYMDLPKTNPMVFPLRPIVPAIDIENESLTHLCKLLELGMIELEGSASSDYSSGMSAPDRDRHLAILAKVEKHVEDFINKEMPLDFVESGRAPINGPGYTPGGNN